MLLLPVLIAVVLSSPPKSTVSEVACQSVADCWLDAESKPIARPNKLKGRAVPRGDCGKKLQWLRNRLACEESVCTVTFIGDKC
jgi:hypothetical protein